MVIRMTVLKRTKPPCLQSHKRHSFKSSKNQWNGALWPAVHEGKAGAVISLYLCSFR